MRAPLKVYGGGRRPPVLWVGVCVQELGRQQALQESPAKASFGVGPVPDPAVLVLDPAVLVLRSMDMHVPVDIHGQSTDIHRTRFRVSRTICMRVLASS